MKLIDRLFFWSVATFTFMAIALKDESFNTLPDTILFMLILFGGFLFGYATVLYPIIAIFGKNDVVEKEGEQC